MMRPATTWRCRRPWATLAVVLASSSVAGWFLWPSLDAAIFHGWTGENIRVTQQRGDEVRRALADYFRANGRYPAALEELTPHFLPEVQLPRTGLPRWIYRVSPDSAAFTLTFTANRDLYPSGTATERAVNGWRMDQ